MNKAEADESVLLTHGWSKSGPSTVLHKWHGEANLNPQSLVYSLPAANIFVYVKLQSWQYNFINAAQAHRISSNYTSFWKITLITTTQMITTMNVLM